MRISGCPGKGDGVEVSDRRRERAGHKNFFREAAWRFGIKEKSAAMRNGCLLYAGTELQTGLCGRALIFGKTKSKSPHEKS
jgi:hypothetical protein